nr:transposase [Xanthomonas vasicola]
MHSGQCRRCHGDAHVAAWQRRQRVRRQRRHRCRQTRRLQDCEAAFFIAARPSTIQGIGSKRERAREQRWEHFKASVRAKVEHPFRVIKRQFGYTTARYRGLAKNTANVLTLCALSNLWMKPKQLPPAMGSVRL